MNATTGMPPADRRPELVRGILARCAQVTLVLLVQAAAMFLGAGRLDWGWAWTYLCIVLVFLAVNGTLMLRRRPDTVAERGQPGEMRGWDKLVSGLWSLVAFLAVPLVSGLDERWAWTGSVAARWHAVGAVAVLAGLALGAWAMAANAFFSTAVRIQAERGQPGEMRGWDKLVSGLWSLVAFLAVPLVSGLDERWAWTGSVAARWHAVGAVAVLAGLALGAWAMAANAFFSTAVRIQAERGHTVCSTGPYRFVRHPGYVGFTVQTLGVPVLLGSWWALVAGVVAGVLMAVRTALEDRVLQAELPGYREYAARVRWRLVPGVW